MVVRFGAKIEYRGMAPGVCDWLYLRNLLKDLGFKSKKAMILYCYNKVVVDIAHNLVRHDRTKDVHMDKRFIEDKLDA